MTEAETAHHLAMSVSDFSRKATEWEKDLGMPRRHPVLCKRDRVAIDQWLDGLFGVDPKTTNVSALVRLRMGAQRDGEGAH